MELDRRSDSNAYSAIASSQDSKQLVNDFQNALSLLKDARPGKISPDEAVAENLIVNHNEE